MLALEISTASDGTKRRFNVAATVCVAAQHTQKATFRIGSTTEALNRAPTDLAIRVDGVKARARSRSNLTVIATFIKDPEDPYIHLPAD
jgi:hypothetical protein